MLHVSTKTIKQLSFPIFGTFAITLLADYLDSNSQKVSIDQQIPFITKFLIHIHENCIDAITNESANGYIDLLFTRTYSTACMARSNIKQFLRYLNAKRYCNYIFIKPAPPEPSIQPQDTNKLKKSYKYYDIFGVKPTATEQEIKKAYHKLAMVFHPDVNHEQNATERFASIVHIYEILSNKEERFEYDVTMGFVSDYITERKKSEYSVRI